MLILYPRYLNVLIFSVCPLLGQRLALISDLPRNSRIIVSVLDIWILILLCGSLKTTSCYCSSTKQQLFSGNLTFIVYAVGFNVEKCEWQIISTFHQFLTAIWSCLLILEVSIFIALFSCKLSVVSTSFFFLFGLWDYRHCGHSWPIVPASGDNEDDCGEHDGM
jgi:hypothetical protein